ncbi:MAG: S-layer homology domain-containing protein, partial [Bacillota bacterium]|nr:S-layer homology domain-containing protein [Bacillota bacterium]
VSYSSNYTSLAAKSGLISVYDNTSAVCTREKAVLMVVRLYELKTGNTASSSTNNVTFSDMWQVSSAALGKMKFAIENGIITGNSSNKLAPKDPVTRGDLMVMLQKVLVLSGEMD